MIEGTHINTVLNEPAFVGNTSAYTALKGAVRQGDFVIFTGAGSSAPLYPTWAQVLGNLIDEVDARGFCHGSTQAGDLRTHLAESPLDVADAIEDLYGYEAFRAKLADIFRGKEPKFTRTHECLVSLPAKGFVTLNYDEGLQHAHVHVSGALPATIRGDDGSELVRWQQGVVFNGLSTPFMQLHGTPINPRGMIFTARDYERFYQLEASTNFVRHLWQSNKLLVVGFGFTDPFLTWISERALRPLPTDLLHYAFIGIRAGKSTSSFDRRLFATKFRLQPIFYQIKSDADGRDDHSDLTSLLMSLLPPSGTDNPLASLDSRPESNRTIDTPTISERASDDFARSLLLAPGGKLLYVEPRLERPTSNAEGAEVKHEPVPLSDIEFGDKSYLVLARAEYGGSTLCRRILRDITASGKNATLADAVQLPNYQKKLTEHFNALEVPSQASTLILDNFDAQDHERLLREIHGLARFERLILIQRAGQPDTNIGIFDELPGNPSVVNLAHVQRSDIRQLAEVMFDTSDANLATLVVDKVYKDFLDLCIPLTPATVIMYLTILHREGDFQPLNRVQIVERYIDQLLRRPTDVYRDSFNIKNKIDVLSSFTYSLYLRGAISVSTNDWQLFCIEYSKRTLIDFDARALMAELVRSKMFVMQNDVIYFRYSVFYSYFLGSHVSNRPPIYREFLQDHRYLVIRDFVEIAAGLSSDNTTLVETISLELSEAIDLFRRKHGLARVDPFDAIKWQDNPLEQEKLWRPIANQLDAGPLAPSEMDQVKSSPSKERRTEDQRVELHTTGDADRKFVQLLFAICAALRNSDSLDGTLKSRAVGLVLEGYFLLYQVMLIHAPRISRSTIYVSNGIAFINSFRIHGLLDKDETKATFQIMASAAPTIAEHAIEAIASRKLSEVFKKISQDQGKEEFHTYLAYWCLLRSKGRGWNQVAEDLVRRTDKKSYYLFRMLNASVRQFREQVNTAGDLASLKRMVALIHAKRDLNQTSPGGRVISDVLRQLEAGHTFDLPDKE